MPQHDYHQLVDGRCTTYEVEHRNDERTRVHIAGDDGAFVVFAVDLARSGFEALGQELIAVTATHQEAVRQAETWMEERPKGLQSGLAKAVSGILGGNDE